MRALIDGCQSQRGDTLIEVVISAALLAVIVIATLNGLDSSNRDTTLQRSRSQADALAEQSEEQLRGESINHLIELEGHPEKKSVTEGGTVYTIESKVTYIADASATASCTSGTSSANYLQTTSKVTWNALLNSKGEFVGKPVEETGIISPPAGSALIVQVSESGTPLPEATVTATGPSPATTKHTLETSPHGCAILALSPGSYNIDVSKAGYVNPNGYAHTFEDESVARTVYLAAETSAKEGYYLGREGKIQVTFGNGESGDTFMAFNTGMSTFKQFGTVESYAHSLESTKALYPFPTAYTVYAGSCEADKPAVIEPENEVIVPSGGTGSTTLTLPQVKLKIYSGTSAGSPGTLVSGAAGSIEDTGCHAKRSFTTTTEGAMPRPGMPYGNYSLCVTAEVGSPATRRRYTSPVELASSSGVERLVYLGGEPESSLTTC